MKKTVFKIAAVLLAAMMMLSLCGCEELLEYALADYAQDYADAYSDYGSYGGYTNGGQGGYSDYLTGGQDGGYSGSGYGSLSDYMELYEQLFGSSMPDISNYTIDESQTAGGGGSLADATVTGNTVLTQAVRDQFTKLKGNGQDKVTVMVYMCASNLESESGLASEDLKEMMRATSNPNLNIVVETGGCKRWHTNGISNSVNQRHVISNGKMTTVDNEGKRKIMTESDTLTDFINFCATNYPADRNILILWDHGGGAVEGYGYDEYGAYDTMTLDELGRALYATNVKFDFIGFDACLMSTMEVGCVLYDFADYMIASEDYEPGYGWEYQRWLSTLAQNTSTPTVELAPIICDDYIVESGSNAGILGCFDLSYMKVIYTAWRDFAYAAEDQLLDANFSWETENNGGRISIEDLTSLFSTTSDIQDMVAIANTVQNVPEAEALISALGNATVYCAANKQDSHMTGMAVTLPYGSKTTYRDIQTIFGNAGFEQDYITFLGKFANVSQGGMYDWSNWYDAWNGWDDYDYGNDYSWDNWSGWDDYNSNDYGWSGYDLYDYIFGNDGQGGYTGSNDYYNDYYNNYGYGNGGYGSGYGNDYGYGDLFDFFNYGGYDDYSDYGYYSDYGNYGGYGNGGYGSGYGNGGYGSSYDYGSSDGGWGDLFNYFFGQ